MKKIINLISLCFACQATAHASTCNTIEGINWLEGSWSSTSEKHTVKENWTRVSPKTFEGHGETISTKDNKLISAETLRLVEMSGDVFYLAKVKSNTLPVAFKLVNCSDTLAEFENQKHDFPKSLRYKLKDKNNMVVRVAGEKGDGFAVDFTKEVNGN